MGRNAHDRAERERLMYEHASKYAAAFEREQAQRQLWESLDHRQQIAAWNEEKARKGPHHAKIAATTTCQLPGCDVDTISIAGASLGICYIHGVDIANYFNIQTEDFQLMVERVSRFESSAKQDRIAVKQAESRRLTPGWIYYVEVADRIKIGYSADVKRRLRQYPPDCPLLAMHPGTKQLESDLHRQFAGSRAAGREWYLDTEEIRQHVREVIAQFGEPDRARYEHRGRMHSGLRAAPPKPTGISR